jgi:hypothetical protein
MTGTPEAMYGARPVAGMRAQVNDLRQAIAREGSPAIQAAWDAIEEHIDYAYRPDAFRPAPVTHD